MNATPRQDPLRRLRTQLETLPGLQPADRARREAAFARFFELGFPAANDEDWKYTSLRRLESRSFVVITHYQRLLNYIVPDIVHVLSKGRIVKTGGKELAHELEASGYAQFQEAPVAAE